MSPQNQPLKRQFSWILPEERSEMENKESLDCRHHVPATKSFTIGYDLDEVTESPTYKGATQEGTDMAHPISLDQDESTNTDLTGGNFGSWKDGLVGSILRYMGWREEGGVFTNTLGLHRTMTPVWTEPQKTSPLRRLQ